MTSLTYLEGDPPRSQRPAARGVCFWYESVDVAKALASQRYRVGNFVELVRGATALAAKRLPPHLLSQVQTVSSIRPLVDDTMANALAALRRSGIRLVADYDDLIFAGDVDGLPASVGGNSTALLKSERLEAYAAGLHAFDHITVSTRALAARVAELSSTPVTIVPNGLSGSWVRHGRALYPAFHEGTPLAIRYFCGSPSHDADFAAIAPAVAAFLHEHPDVSLEVVGPLRFDDTSFPRAQLRRLASVPYDELPRLLADTWVALAPLVDNPFNDCRSAIKFLEAGAFSCPTLCSPNDDLRRHQELGAPLLFCLSPRDWYEQLSALRDPARRREQGAAAAEHVTAHGMAAQQLDPWLAALTRRSAS